MRLACLVTLLGLVWTQRRANVRTAGVAFCYGTSIGIAVGIYHMFVAYIRGVRNDWGGKARSKDAMTWEKQGMVLDKNGIRPDDSPTGAHADVIVVGDKSYIFYFTHPGRKTHGAATLDKDGGYPYSEKRSSIQAAELVFRGGTLEAVRDEPFEFWLPGLN